MPRLRRPRKSVGSLKPWDNGASPTRRTLATTSTKFSEPLTLGEAFAVDVSVAATSPSTAPDLATTPVTLVFDGPPTTASPSGARIVFRWRPAGTSSPQFSFAGGVLTLSLTAAEVAAQFTAGNWVVGLLDGTPATNQDYVGSATLYVREPSNGGYPVSG